MKGHIQEKSLIIASSVASVLVKQSISENTKESTLEKSLINANSVTSVSVKDKV